MPPHSLEAEQAVLGGLLLDNSTWDSIADRLRAEDFYRRDHQLIFEAIARPRRSAGEPSDAVTLAEHLASKGLADETGGLAYLAGLARDTPTAANIRAYADIVRERSLLRQLIRVSGEIAGSAYENEGKPAAELVDEAERRVFEIAEKGRKHGLGLRAGARRARAPRSTASTCCTRSQGQLTGRQHGLHRARQDDRRPAARRPRHRRRPPVDGQDHARAQHRRERGDRRATSRSPIFSMEMSREQLAFRMISSLGRVDQGHMRTGNFGDEDWARINSAIAQMKSAPIYIDDSGSLTPTEVRARARRLQAREAGGLGLIVIDYLQLMQVAGNKENRATEISEISRSLKALAKELRVPVIALSQLNRSVEQRQDKKPVMSDLRESGAIEQDADLIMMIYREEVYEPDTPRKGIADIIIAKQRNGPTGEVHLTFLGKYTRFENLAPATTATTAAEARAAVQSQSLIRAVVDAAALRHNLARGARASRPAPRDGRDQGQRLRPRPRAGGAGAGGRRWLRRRAPRRRRSRCAPPGSPTASCCSKACSAPSSSRPPRSARFELMVHSFEQLELLEALRGRAQVTRLDQDRYRHESAGLPARRVRRGATSGCVRNARVHAGSRAGHAPGVARTTGAIRRRASSSRVRRGDRAACAGERSIANSAGVLALARRRVPTGCGPA